MFDDLSPSTAQAIAGTTADFTVSVRPAFAHYSTPGMTTTGISKTPESRFCLVVRDDTGEPLGQVTKSYNPLQPRQAFGFADSLAEDGHVTFEDVYVTKGGAEIALFARINNGDFEVVPGDVQHTYLLFRTTYDGSGSTSGLLLSRRPACMNMAAGILSGQASFKVRHTRNQLDRLSEARLDLGLILDQVDRYKAFCKKLANTYIGGNLSDKLEVIAPGDSKRAENVRQAIARLYVSGRGTQIEGVKGTAWGLFNAVTEYTTHHSSKNAEQRFRSGLGGSGLAMNRRAAEVLTAL